MSATINKRIVARIRFDADSRLYQLSFSAMGTDCRAIFEASSNQSAAHFANCLVQWVANFESKYSRFLEASLLSEINRKAGISPVTIDEETNKLLDICESAYRETNGLVDATSLPLTKLWDHRKTHRHIPTDRDIATALLQVGWEKVYREKSSVFLSTPGMELDFGGFGKEFAVDRAAEIATDLCIQNFLIDFGGDIRTEGHPPNADYWTIGIEDPRTPGLSHESIFVQSAGIASSGNYRRNFVHDGVTYGHIIHPKNGRPNRTQNLIATVVSNTCLRSGTLATAACLTPIEEAIQEIELSPQSEGRILQDGKIASTTGFHEFQR